MGELYKPAAAAYGRAFTEVTNQLQRDVVKHPRRWVRHEGIAVIEEEFLELREVAFWGERTMDPDEQRAAMYSEARQVAATAIRFMCEVCEGATLSRFDDDREPIAAALGSLGLSEDDFDPTDLPFVRRILAGDATEPVDVLEAFKLIDAARRGRLAS